MTCMLFTACCSRKIYYHIVEESNRDKITTTATPALLLPAHLYTTNYTIHISTIDQHSNSNILVSTQTGIIFLHSFICRTHLI